MRVKCHLHKCGKYLYFVSDNYEEKIPIIRKGEVRIQTTDIIQKVIDTWEPSKLFIGNVNPDTPTIIDDFNLPKIWEKK